MMVMSSVYIVFETEYKNNIFEALATEPLENCINGNVFFPDLPRLATLEPINLYDYEETTEGTYEPELSAINGKTAPHPTAAVCELLESEDTRFMHWSAWSLGRNSIKYDLEALGRHLATRYCD
ncbi:hypothetical protein X975_02842, partial [Stegodyphus mimosarum]